MKIILAHDYLTQRGGAERVVLELVRALKPKKIITAIYSPRDAHDEFKELEVESTPLSRVSIFRRDARLALPLLPFFWSWMNPVEADAVVCSSAGWAHALQTRGGTKKIVYCHNPARWLYQTQDYLCDRPALVKALFHLIRPMLERWDQRKAMSVDLYVANSTTVAARIKRVYNREARVIFPPVSVDPALPLQPVRGLADDFFLMVGRPRGYKGTSSLIEAFKRMPAKNLVIAGGKIPGEIPPNVRSLGFVNEAELRWLYSNARALLSVSREDFGLTPIEAYAFGTPALLLRAGGFLDTMAEGVSGHFIEDEDADTIVRAVMSFPEIWDQEAIRAHALRFSPERFAREMREALLSVDSSSRGS